jgi:hypothetical protein
LEAKSNIDYLHQLPERYLAVLSFERTQMKIREITYKIECSCGCVFLAQRKGNKSIFFKCPGCQKDGGINPKEKVQESDMN